MDKEHIKNGLPEDDKLNLFITGWLLNNMDPEARHQFVQLLIAENPKNATWFAKVARYVAVENSTLDISKLRPTPDRANQPCLEDLDTEPQLFFELSFEKGSQRFSLRETLSSFYSHIRSKFGI